MTRTSRLFTALAALFLLGSDALAARVTCQSRDYQREECTLRDRGEVVLVQQISKTACVKGKNWNETRNGVYVTDGCAAVFETRGGGGGNGGGDGHGRPDDRPGQGGGWSGGPGQGDKGDNNDYRDLVGVRASSGESELRRRGYREARSEPAPGGRTVFWRTPSRGCIEVRVADGRYRAIRPVSNRDCEAGRPLPPDRPMPGGGAGWPQPDACLMQFNNQGSQGAVESQHRVRPGVWEFIVLFPEGRHRCLVNDRGQLISFDRAN